MGGDLESRCLGRVNGAGGAVRLVLSSWGVVRVNDQLKQGVRIAWALFGNHDLRSVPSRPSPNQKLGYVKTYL